MKNVKITRRSFLLGLGAASSALLLSACGSVRQHIRLAAA